MTDADVLVVGGGIAGLCAANRAAEAGLSVVVLERGESERYPCNSRFTGGAYHVGFRDVAEPPAALYDALRRVTGGHAREELVRTLAVDALRAVRWLQAQGVRFVKGPESYQHWLLAPPRANRAGLHWEWRCGDTLLRRLEQVLALRGGQIRRGAEVQSLETAQGRCVGVVAQIGGKRQRVAGAAVLIADGGFQGSHAALRGTISPAPEKLLQRGAGTGIGSGLAMARDAGAGVTDCSAFYGHLLSRDALHNPDLWPWPTLDLLAGCGLLVDEHGARFTDEGSGGVAMANALARRDDPLCASIVVDHAIWMGPGAEKFIPANPHLARAGGTIHQSPDLASLAAAARLPAERLRASVKAHNARCAGGPAPAPEPGPGPVPTRDSTRHPDRDPPRSGAPLPLATPPFYAIPVCAGITYTMGGIAIDARSRVLDASDAPIPGLWAAGTTTGGLEGGPGCAYVGGLARSAVTALRAAESIALTLGSTT